MPPAPSDETRLLLDGLLATVVSRAEWGAHAPVDWPVEHAEVRGIVLHHTATRNDEPEPDAMLRRVQGFHADQRGWGDIGYSFIVAEDGRIFEGRAGSTLATAPQHVVAGHAYSHNVGTIGISVAGRFHDCLPAGAAWSSLVDLVATIARTCELDPEGGPVELTNGRVLPAVISGHRNACDTSCPGDALYRALDELRRQAASQLVAGDGVPRRPRIVAPSGGDAAQNAG